MEKIEKRIREIMWEISGEEEKKQMIFEKETINISEDLEFDSASSIQFILRIEKEFGVSFDDSEIANKVWDSRKLAQWMMTVK
ncbi:MAG: acyl carrier protein [Lachnospiraceae bacterium]|nr:acyl carrier protein [Lachnospiraceae bacterium]MBQ3664982.1 acyl carrier protein [Lachnospiraceae bacterium]